MTESMIERVARAIYDKWAETERTTVTFDEMVELQQAQDYPVAKRIYRLSFAEAKNAISAMREPTEAMHDAARDWSQAKYGKPIGSDASLGCWQAMLDAALSPTTGDQGQIDG